MMAAAKKTTNVGRAWLSGIMIVLAVVLTPVAVLTNWATVQVSNEAQFVKTLSPLASNPAVQNTVIDSVTKAIDDQLDINQVTDSLLGGLGTALNLPPEAKKALGLVSNPIASGVQNLIHDVVTKAVQSDAFQKGWTEALTFTQKQAVDLLSNNGKSALSLSNDGTITLPLAPIITQVKAQLVADKVMFANMIPVVDTSITIAKIPELVVVRTVYQIGVGVGTWLPWIVLALFGAGALIANRRARAVQAIGTSLIVVAGVVAIALPMIRVIASNAVGSAYSAAATVVFDAVIDYMAVMLGGLAMLGVVLTWVGWNFGSSKSAAATRAFFAKYLGEARGLIAPESKDYAAAVAKVYNARIIVRVVVLALIGFWMASIQPLNVASVIWLSLLAALLLGVFEVMARPLAAVVAPAAVVVTAPATAKPAAKKAPAKKAAAKPAAKKKPAAK